MAKFLKRKNENMSISSIFNHDCNKDVNYFASQPQKNVQLFSSKIKNNKKINCTYCSIKFKIKNYV
jgi:DNA-directed RNA polymerase subunit RPC12/RpoP